MQYTCKGNMIVLSIWYLMTQNGGKYYMYKAFCVSFILKLTSSDTARGLEKRL